MKKLLALLAATLVSSQAEATTFRIGALEQGNSGFRYSLFHKGTGSDAMSGSVLAHLLLDDTWTGSTLDAINPGDDGTAFYRESDGAIEFRADVYSDATFADLIGSVVVTGTGFVPNRLDSVGRTNTVIDLLKMVFDLDPSALATWLGGEDETRSMTVVDRGYNAHSAEGTQANTYANGQLALWAARGFIAEINASGGAHLSNADWLAAHPGAGNQTGIDLVVGLGGEVIDCKNDPICNPIPEPAALVLLGTGLVGLAVYRLRQR